MKTIRVMLLVIMGIMVFGISGCSDKPTMELTPTDIAENTEENTDEVFYDAADFPGNKEEEPALDKDIKKIIDDKVKPSNFNDIMFSPEEKAIMASRWIEELIDHRTEKWGWKYVSIDKAIDQGGKDGDGMNCFIKVTFINAEGEEEVEAAFGSWSSKAEDYLY